MSDLFDQTDNTPVTLEDKDYVSELVGEGKKFKDIADLAKGKAFSDAHITNLERTLAAMREELQTRKTAEELINQISTVRKKTDGESNPDLQDTQLNGQEVKSGLTAEDVEKLLASREAQRKQTDNLNQATQKLKDMYGATAAAEVQRKAAELGVDPAYLRSMASSAPGAFLALFTATPRTERDNMFTPPASTFRPTPQLGLTEKWSDFNKVKSADPKTYWSPAFQRKLAEAAERAAQAGKSEEFYRS